MDYLKLSTKSRIQITPNCSLPKNILKEFSFLNSTVIVDNVPHAKMKPVHGLTYLKSILKLNTDELIMYYPEKHNYDIRNYNIYDINGNFREPGLTEYTFRNKIGSLSFIEILDFLEYQFTNCKRADLFIDYLCTQIDRHDLFNSYTLKEVNEWILLKRQQLISNKSPKVKSKKTLKKSSTPSPKTKKRPTHKQIALYHFYLFSKNQGFPITTQNCKQIALKFGWKSPNSGKSIYDRYRKITYDYQEIVSKGKNRVEDLKVVLELLQEHPEPLKMVKEDLKKAEKNNK